MSWLVRLGIPAAVLIAGYFALNFIANNWVWFLSGLIIVSATSLCAWVLFHTEPPQPMDPEARHHEQIMRELDQLPSKKFDATIGQLLTGLNAKQVKKFGHKGSDLGCNFVVTLTDGKRIIVRAKQNDGTMRRMGERHLKALGWETKPRWNCDHAVLLTSADLHWMNHGPRNDKLARHLGITLIDRKRLAEWLDSGSPPAALRPRLPREISAQAALDPSRPKRR
ncbi:restriction endonuclease [Haloglycomyces albus]|uniref:restriction endonuclease n=1 Tax=Haloglycomyces albus TaxID=526067 RepID=UPI00046D7BFA|nr:restriction endonuclease [Haloglycomyces albus]